MYNSNNSSSRQLATTTTDFFPSSAALVVFSERPRKSVNKLRAGGLAGRRAPAHSLPNRPANPHDEVPPRPDCMAFKQKTHNPSEIKRACTQDIFYHPKYIQNGLGKRKIGKNYSSLLACQIFFRKKPQKSKGEHIFFLNRDWHLLK